MKRDTVQAMSLETAALNFYVYNGDESMATGNQSIRHGNQVEVNEQIIHTTGIFYGQSIQQSIKIEGLVTLNLSSEYNWFSQLEESIMQHLHHPPLRVPNVIGPDEWS